MGVEMPEELYQCRGAIISAIEQADKEDFAAQAGFDLPPMSTEYICETIISQCTFNWARKMDGEIKVPMHLLYKHQFDYPIAEVA